MIRVQASRSEKAYVGWPAKGKAYGGGPAKGKAYGGGPAKGETLKVALLVNSATHADRERIRGILRFAATCGRWHTFLFRDHLATQHFAKTAHWCPDGIIAERFAFEEAMRQYGRDCCRARCAVLLDSVFRLPFRCKTAVTSCNNEAVGRAAADFYMKRGYSAYAVVGTPNRRNWSEARGKAYAARLAEAGFPCSTYNPKDTRDWGDEISRLGEWLQDLPKPCALFATVDHRAKHVLDIAAETGVKVPDELAVIGVDNDDMICEFTSPSLTSINLDFEQNGFLAAKTLEKLMQGDENVADSLSFGVLGIVERLSTSDQTGTVRIVSRAREFIRLNAASDISVDDVARVVGCSPRLLQQRFHDILGHSPIVEVRNTRLELAAKILRGTQTPVDRIGDLCGFKTPSNLKAAFKVKFGMSMSAYRTSVQTAT